MKKILLILLALILVFSLIGNAFAQNPEMNENNNRDFINSNEAANIAIWFIANDIKNNPDSLWTKNTRLSKATELYDENNNITGYTFELQNGSQYNGYIVISGSSNNSLIHEFSYTAKPLFYEANSSNFEKVYYTAPLEYFLKINNKYKNIDKKDITFDKIKNKFKIDKVEAERNNKIIDRIRKLDHINIDEWMLGYKGQVSNGGNGYGGIYDPYTYVNDRYGTGWTLINSNFISGVYPHLQSDFELNVNNCTLSVLTTIFEYYKNKGKTNIPSNVYDIYKDVKAIAEKHGYTPTGGTWPTVIDDIVNDLWTKYKYSGKGENVYLWSYDTFKNEVDNNRPACLNINSGYYSNHSVTLVGYRTYDNGLKPAKGFLKVYDNWTTSDRYIDYAVFSSETLASITRVYSN